MTRRTGNAENNNNETNEGCNWYCNGLSRRPLLVISLSFVLWYLWRQYQYQATTTTTTTHKSLLPGVLQLFKSSSSSYLPASAPGPYSLRAGLRGTCDNPAYCTSGWKSWRTRCCNTINQLTIAATQSTYKFDREIMQIQQAIKSINNWILSNT
jgi:hypothetical protein